MRRLIVALFFCVPMIGCGDGSDVPQELRAPPAQQIPPSADVPKGAMPVESPL